VVLASRGYPESSESGQPIDGIAEAEAMAGVAVSRRHSGAAAKSSPRWAGADRRRPRRRFRRSDLAGYGGVQKISLEEMQYRRDIGKKALSHDA
jgi:phosphoribosylamine--glycine ligase